MTVKISLLWISLSLIICVNCSTPFICRFTVKGGPQFNKRCSTIFIYNDLKFIGCTREGDPDGRLWCSTRTTNRHRHIEGSQHWGYCDENCPEDPGVPVVKRRKVVAGRIPPVIGNIFDNKTHRHTNNRATSRPSVTSRPTRVRPITTSRAPTRRTRPTRRTTRRSTTTPTPRTSTPIISSQVDSTSGKWLPDPAFGECGESLITRRRNPGAFAALVGGSMAVMGQFPFLALLGYLKVDGFSIEYLCGGTLINRRYVVTAAHCHHRTKPSKQIAEVVLGEFTVGTDPDCFDCPPAQRYEVRPSDVKIHEKYFSDGPPSQGNDIALIRLTTLATTYLENTKNLVMPVCLPWKQTLKPSDILGQYYVAGWGQSTYFAADVGNLKRFGVLEPNMLYAQLPIVNNDECNVQLGNVHPEYHICAGGVLGVDSCNGDSGGPLFGRQNRSSPFVLRGIVSFGTPICGVGAPGVYTNIYHYLPWILRNIKP